MIILFLYIYKTASFHKDINQIPVAYTISFNKIPYKSRLLNYHFIYL